eukprot:230697-Chlamydomonas_euryale.AAC.5
MVAGETPPRVLGDPTAAAARRKRARTLVHPSRSNPQAIKFELHVRFNHVASSSLRFRGLKAAIRSCVQGYLEMQLDFRSYTYYINNHTNLDCLLRGLKDAKDTLQAMSDSSIHNHVVSPTIRHSRGGLGPQPTCMPRTPRSKAKQQQQGHPIACSAP